MTVADRPVTQQGIAGMRLKSAGPGRQVQDLSFHMSVLRTRISETSSELGRLRTEIDTRRRDASTYQALERRYEGLIKEVRGLEGELADYNLAADKSRAGTDPSEIHQYFLLLKRRNEEEARAIDQIFLERQERERGVARLEEQITELQRLAERRLATLPPDKQAEYRSLTEANRAMGSEVATRQAELEGLNARMEEAETELRRDPWREQCAVLERKALTLRREQATLEEELGTSRLDPAAARERLMAKVKAESQRVQQLDAEIADVTAELERKRKTLEEVSAELEERKSGAAGDDSAKYEVLYKRDQEMTEFIDRFPELKARESAEQQRVRDTVVALLEHMSSGLEREHSMPSKEEAGEMAADLGDKQRELGASKTTQERLQDELVKRQAELEKINTLDEKIEVELASLSTKMEQMRRDMEVFQDLDGLRSKSEAITDTLETKRGEYTRRRDAMRTQLSGVAADLARLQTQVDRDRTAKELEDQEKRLKQYETQIFAMREFVESKALETEYGSVRDDCRRILGELNTTIVRVQSSVVSSVLSSEAAGLGFA